VYILIIKNVLHYQNVLAHSFRDVIAGRCTFGACSAHAYPSLRNARRCRPQIVFFGAIGRVVKDPLTEFVVRIGADADDGEDAKSPRKTSFTQFLFNAGDSLCRSCYGTVEVVDRVDVQRRRHHLGQDGEAKRRDELRDLPVCTVFGHQVVAKFRRQVHGRSQREAIPGREETECPHRRRPRLVPSRGAAAVAIIAANDHPRQDCVSSRLQRQVGGRRRAQLGPIPPFRIFDAVVIARRLAQVGGPERPEAYRERQPQDGPRPDETRSRIGCRFATRSSHGEQKIPSARRILSVHGLVDDRH